MSFKALFVGKEFAYERGRDDFRKGRPRPAGPPKDDDPDALTAEGVRWFGYMVERGKDYFERRRVAEALGCDPDTVKPEDDTEGAEQ